MQAKTKRRINLTIIWLLVILFGASTFLLYLPVSGPEATPPPATNPGTQVQTQPGAQTVTVPETAATPQP
ncbi:MAG: hypothetical protein M3N59_02300 [bacterium]|nr:hypothetical protein [bacterium]